MKLWLLKRTDRDHMWWIHLQGELKETAIIFVYNQDSSAIISQDNRESTIEEEQQSTIPGRIQTRSQTGTSIYPPDYYH